MNVSLKRLNGCFESFRIETEYQQLIISRLVEWVNLISFKRSIHKWPQPLSRNDPASVRLSPMYPSSFVIIVCVNYQVGCSSRWSLSTSVKQKVKFNAFRTSPCPYSLIHFSLKELKFECLSSGHSLVTTFLLIKHISLAIFSSITSLWTWQIDNWLQSLG